jgi:hypothetical protein
LARTLIEAMHVVTRHGAADSGADIAAFRTLTDRFHIAPG